MPISNELLDRVNEDPYEVCLEVCKWVATPPQMADANSQLEVVLFLTAVIEGDLIKYEGEVPVPENGKIHKAVAMSFIASVQTQIQDFIRREAAISFQRETESRFKQIVKGGFGYEFSEADIHRVQDLINELRGLITANGSLSEGHKRRLLNRLEGLQKELHKKVSDLSHFYSLMGDAGIALGKLGVAAKPFVERIHEIVQIGWTAQARAEELPSSAVNPMIGHERSPELLE